MPWTPDPAGGGGGGGALPIPTFAGGAQKQGGGPFIDWSSPLSVLSSPVRGTVAAAQGFGDLVQSAGRGLLELPGTVGEEALNNAKRAYFDVTHPSLGHFAELATGMPNLAHSAAEALPALGLGGEGTPWKLRPGEKPAPDVPTGWTPYITQVANEGAPASAGIVQSAGQTGMDIEQVTRAGVNRLLPGTPAGAGVGQLGSGAGLLGKTDLAKAAARGGGGVGAPLLNDAVNLSIIGAPIEKLVTGASEEAAAQAAAHGETLSAATEAQSTAVKAARDNVAQATAQANEAAQGLSDARAAASTGHPAAAADVVVKQSAVSSAMNALRSAQEMAAQVEREHGNNVTLAEQAQTEAQGHADRLAKHAKTVKLATGLASKAAASPFAPLEYGAPALLRLAAPFAHDLVGSELGQRYLGPVVDRAHRFAAQVEANREMSATQSERDIAKGNVDAQLARGFQATAGQLPAVEEPVGRGPFGLFGTKTVPLRDVDAEAVATMAQTGESAHLRNLLRDLPRDEALDVFSRAVPKDQYTPAQLDLAAEVFGPGEATGKALAVREALPGVREAYAKEGGALDVQNRRYAGLVGEAGVSDVRPAPGAGAFAQVEHNLAGTGPRIEGLEQWQKALTSHSEDSAAVRRTVEDPAAQQRALDRLDRGLADKQREIEASPAAASRPLRPILQLGLNIKEILDPIAEQAERDLGPGAGDVYRALAAEATITAHELVTKYGVDPQFLIGAPGERGGLFGINEGRSGGPVVGKTGQREAGIGLKHATDYETLYRQTRARAYKAIDNITGQRIISARGGDLGAMLEARGVENVGEMTHEQLAAAMKDAGLAAWDFSDRRGGLLRNQQLTLDARVVPIEVYRAWQRYAEKPAGSAETFMRSTYDPVTQKLKQLIRLSPRWQVQITMGHAVMAMAGIGADPATYFGHDVPTAWRLDRMARTGEITAEDSAWIRQQHPNVQAGLAESGFVPGAVRRRGFVESEFAPTEGERSHFGDRGMALQGSLDNIHRTAVWIHQLERGLDATGLADFRTAFPDLAHLSDTQIQNEAAIRLSIRTMGDYLNRTPFERQTMSRVIFFYPWLKHITKLALNTAIHDPLRTAWMLHLGAMFDPGPGPVNFLESSFDAGKNRWITPPKWNPFEHGLISLGDNPLGSVNPIIQTGVAGATGFNLGTGKAVTRPPGHDGPLSLGELGNFAAGRVPLLPQLAASAGALQGHAPIVRYQTGEPVISGGRFIPANESQFPGTNRMLPDWLAPLAPLTGLPQQRLVNADQIVARQAATDKRDAAARAKYEKRRALLSRG